MTAYADKASIMAIGDSMYQGVRSLSITADRARNSVPAIVARALGRSMTLPLMRRPILYDIEVLIRQGGILHLVDAVRQVALQNVDAWINEPTWSSDEAYDNLALGGAAISDLWEDDFATYWPKVLSYRDAIVANNGAVGDLVRNIAGLWYALNVCFVLNPSRKANTPQATASPIDQVRDRKPDILLVNIGSNEGLFRAGFTGHYDDKAKASIDAIPDKMETLADKLKAAVPQATQIYVNSLIRPRVIPNLSPRKIDYNYPHAGYFPEYIAHVGDGLSRLTANDMRDFDNQVLGINRQVQQRMAAVLGPQLTFVDLYTASDGFDGKHYGDRGVAIPNAGIHLRNLPFETMFGHFSPCGVGGLDNMHPTVPGYTLMAKAVLDTMTNLAKPGLATALDMDAAYAADALLQDLPATYPLFAFEMALLGSFGLLADVSI